MHFVMTTSDCFFHEFLTQSTKINSEHIELQFLDDLNEECAFTFFTENLEVSDRSVQLDGLWPKDLDSFRRDVFSLTGGRMLHIENFIKQSKQLDRFVSGCCCSIDHLVTLLTDFVSRG